MGAVGVIIERIPHNTVSYAYLEIQAANANEFEALREEALKKIPHYAFASASPAEPKVVEAGGEVEKQPDSAGPEASSAGEEQAPVPTQPEGTSPAPTSTEGLSPREIARARLAQKTS